MKNLYRNTSTKNIVAILFLCVCTCIVSCSEQPGNQPAQVVLDDQHAIPALLPRKNNLGNAAEQQEIVKAYNEAIQALKTNPEDRKQYLTLATVFISEGRVTGNNDYYGNAAVKMLDFIIDGTAPQEDLKFEALSLKSAVFLNMHQFKDAFIIAEEGRKLNDFNAGIYGALVDANVELGNYKEAVADCDKMLSIRPDLRSYSRASYLRQIHGDNNGAIEAMKMAVEAGVPGIESTEWARVTLGDLYLNTGKPDTAAMIYRSSLVYRPDYPYAEIGLAKVARLERKYNDAITHAKNAIKVLSEASFVTLLGEIYQEQGNAAKAKEVYADVLSLMEAAEKDQSREGILVKHNTSRELAYAYINAGDLDKALECAKRDYSMRPSNIDANDLMAWVCYLKGNYATAKEYADKVLVTKTQNAGMLYRVGLIYDAAGLKDAAANFKQQARSISPYADKPVLIAKK